jgi:Mrp family chromosome partitioning ATPase
VKVLAEIPARRSSSPRAGSLRRRDVDVYRGLLQKLGDAHCVLVTGTTPVWRSVATGLAATAAAGGSRVALLECDLGDPALADALGLANAPGLQEYLCGVAAVEEILQPLVLAGPGSAAATEPLVCVVAGRPANAAWAQLASDRFRGAIDGLRAGYELLVIGGPPLSDRYALRGVLGFVDATLACIAPGESKRKLPIAASGLVVVG